MMANAKNLSPIDWGVLSRAIEYYRDVEGFEMVEVPWIVPTEISKKTFDGTPYELIPGPNLIGSGQSLIGSAEQAFLYLLSIGSIKTAKNYMGLSPCFRNEKELKPLTQKHFMKLELFFAFAYPIDEEEGWEMAKTAFDVFYNEGGKNGKLKIVKTDQGYDIMLNDIEVGSYGVRNAIINERKIWWVYGTGLAEPRFSSALKRKHEEKRVAEVSGREIW